MGQGQQVCYGGPSVRRSCGACYQVNDWLGEFERHRSSHAKQLAYFALWPLLHLEARRWLSEHALRAWSPAAVLRERGFPVEARRRWALSGLNIRESVVLVQGTGSGWDVLTWAHFRPKRIIATDLFTFDSWKEVSQYAARRWHVACEFHQAPLEDHHFLADGSVDACVSDAVFEHCRNLNSVLGEARRVLRPGGRLYAAYGPLWFSPGGDHYSGRGGFDTLYNHLLLTRTDYQAYIERYRKDVEGFQDGYRYVELDLFSHMTTDAYLQVFRKHGFIVDELILQLSSLGLRFRRTFPEQYERLLEATKGRCAHDDLVVAGHLVKLTRAPA